ncbi:1,4-dihydroxy-2-naphthoate octaprenyltransferase [Ulvibacterium marinum]|uniref:1,4-dihydroxy-2-naphthoate octaprenyltransferase n=1 Tax=Ulvibacterium marinum TaxID=2419782 RepID=UPI002494FF5F|nr:1,4-dihydroxy-2-naphthoate octaprenyltransferase [Ulvibacterium marinum]
MPKTKIWLDALRLRTLPLSVSGIIVGTALANFYGKVDVLVFVLALFTAIGFQITSNLANDYGDGVKGTDNESRIGPKRALQSGLLSKEELKKGIVISSVLNFFLILVVVYAAFGKEQISYLLLFIVLGAASVWAAIKYTVGSSAYGYKGMGDLFVFIFFGLVAVLGSMFLNTKVLQLEALLPACTIGFLSTGVLNLNNLRDYESDTQADKNTLVVRIGFKNGKTYHSLLLLSGFATLLWFVLLNFTNWYHFISLVLFIPIFIHMHRVYKTDAPVLLDPELKKLALNTFALAIIFYISFNNFL